MLHKAFTVFKNVFVRGVWELDLVSDGKTTLG